MHSHLASFFLFHRLDSAGPAREVRVKETRDEGRGNFDDKIIILSTSEMRKGRVYGTCTFTRVSGRCTYSKIRNRNTAVQIRD